MNNLKKITLALCTLLLVGGTAIAQKVGIVNTAEVLESIEDYRNSQAELDRLADQWRQEIAQEHDKIKSEYNRYQAEQVLMSDEARRQKEEQIIQMEQQVRDLQKRRFGPEGDLFERRRELVEPIQERVYKAIEDYAAARDYDIILDKSSNAGLIFSNDKYDITRDVLRELGN